MPLLGNLSNIGFGVNSDDDFYEMANRAYQMGYPIDASEGFYIRYTDPSGAELWLQLNKEHEFVGLNPHYLGKSRRNVALMEPIDRPDGLLDGAFLCWADPSDKTEPETGAYPFVFDLPDFATIGHMDFPHHIEMQLAAFALEVRLFEDQDSFAKTQGNELSLGTKSFIPSGLFSSQNKNSNDTPLALGILTGLIKEHRKNENQLSKKEFHWLLVETLGGEIDVLIDPNSISTEPTVGGVVQGQFWLSGRLINPPTKLKKKGILPIRNR